MSALTDLIDSVMLAKQRGETPRDYFGASRWGEECGRMLAYDWHGTPIDGADKFPARILRIFDMGHDAEPRVAAYLRLAGFTVLTEQEDGEQFGFTALGGKLAGHCDGIITAGPLDLPYPIAWENKAVGKGIWRDVSTKGLREGKPVYFGQIQTYCAYIPAPDGTALNGGLFTMINRETGEIHDEFIPFDAVEAQALSDRAVQIVQTDRPEDMPRISSNPAFWKCGFCDYQKRCHDIRPLEMKVAPQASPAFPSWLTAKKP